MLLSWLGTVALIMNNSSWSVLLEWSWTGWNCYSVPNGLGMNEFWWLHVFNWDIWVCGIGENDYADWEGLSCLWLPLMAMEVWITWIYLAVMGSTSPILLHDHETLSSCPVAPLAVELYGWKGQCSSWARARLGLVWQCLTAGSWSFSLHSKLFCVWLGAYMCSWLSDGSTRL